LENTHEELANALSAGDEETMAELMVTFTPHGTRNKDCKQFTNNKENSFIMFCVREQIYGSFFFASSAPPPGQLRPKTYSEMRRRSWQLTGSLISCKFFAHLAQKHYG
jgi:hypothetical protein